MATANGWRLLLVVLVGVGVLQGCAPLVVVGAATAATAANDRRTVGAFIDDGAIELKSRSALNSDPALHGNMHLSVTSMNGIVLLSGEVTRAELRERALAHVRAVPGIRRVADEITIGDPASFGSRTYDGWLTTKVKTKLIAEDDLDSTRVKVVTENDAVYLMGLVTRAEAKLATDAARTTRGVARVITLFEYLD